MDIIKNELKFVPRNYQIYYLEKAKEQNVIICLSTGSGKTYITIMLLKEYGKQIRIDKKKGIFLAPTQPLVVQQYEQIQKHTNYRCKVYYGDLGVDTWDEMKWRSEILDHHILVLTPDIFYQILSKQIIKLDELAILIIDECHWGGFKRKGKNGVAETGHAYKKIMDFIIDNQYHNKIRIVGTTASVINASFNTVFLPECCNQLEKTFNAKILGEFDMDPRYFANPKIIVWLYREEISLNKNFIQLFSIHEKLDAIIKENKSKNNDSYFKNMLNLSDYLFERPLLKPDYAKRIICDLMDVQNELGVWPAYIICQEFRKELNESNESIKRELNTCLLIKLVDRYLFFCEQLYEKSIKKLKINDTDRMLNFVTSKLLRLLDIIYLYKESRQKFSALVFVKRVLFSFSISKFLEYLSSYDNQFSFIKSKFFVGSNNDYLNFKFIKESVKNSEKTIKEFKEGKLNLLITTSVLEEGIDIGKCNLVIRFSEPKTYREFMQSKGRARDKDAYFVILHDNLSKMKQSINVYFKIEEFLNYRFKMSKLDEFKKSVLPDDYKVEHEEEFIKSATGSLLFMNEAGPFLSRYLSRKGNKNYISNFIIDEINSIGFKAKLSLQGITPLKDDCEGKIYEDRVCAFKSACLAACKALYEINQLDDHFVPITEDATIKRCNLIRKEYGKKEIKEMEFIFSNKIKKMYEKKICDFEYFKRLTKSTGYDLYELQFDTEDPFLKGGIENLALCTELNLNQDCETTTLYSSLYLANIHLKLIKKDILFDQDQLDIIAAFTCKIFQSTISLLEKRKNDSKFDIEKCLFKFLLLDKQKSIDYDQIKKFIQFNQSNQHDLAKEDCLVKATHTNTNYKFKTFSTNVYPYHSFYLNGKMITYNQYYKDKYHIVNLDQKGQLVEVEKANLISLYSIYIPKEKDVVENKSSNFKVYIPKELIIILPITKSFHKKLTTLPPLIFRLKQKLILEHMYQSLNQKVLNIEQPDQKFENIFDSSQICKNNIDKFFGKIYKKNENYMPIYKSSEECSSDEQPNENIDNIIEYSDLEISAIQNFDNSIKELVNRPTNNKKEEYQKIESNESIIFPSIKVEFLNQFLNESFDETLKENDYSNLDEFLNQFIICFKEIIEKCNRKVNIKNFEDIEPKLKRRKMAGSNDFKNINFNIWTNKLSDKLLITKSNLLKALTTKSAGDAVDLERQEFIGDCFLKLLTCSLLFHLYPNVSVGELDILKISAVSNKNLFRISKRMRILEFMFAESFNPGINWLPDGFEYNCPDSNSSKKLVTLFDKAGYRNCEFNSVIRNKYQKLKAKSISDSIESLIGGVLLSSGIRNACLFIKYLGIYSNEGFELKKESKQEEWFKKKYDPITNDLSKRFIITMYQKYGFDDLENSIDYKFKNKGLLIQAFKHVSCNEFNDYPSYEKLEFLGDAVIDYLIARYYYDTKIVNSEYENESKNLTPGELSSLKESLINNEFFGTLSVKFGLDDFLIYNNQTIFNMIASFKDAYNSMIGPQEDVLIVSNSYFLLTNPDSIKFKILPEIPKVLGDIFESLMAAVFIDSNFCLNTTWNVLYKFMIKELTYFRNNNPKTFVKVMHELYPGAKFGDHIQDNLGCKISIEINGVKFTGRGKNKRLAKIDAAKNVIMDFFEKRE